jgi:hypothetical protein
MKTILSFFRGKPCTPSVQRETSVSSNTHNAQQVHNMNAALQAGKDMQDLYAFYR